MAQSSHLLHRLVSWSVLGLLAGVGCDAGDVVDGDADVGELMFSESARGPDPHATGSDLSIRGGGDRRAPVTAATVPGVR